MSPNQLENDRRWRRRRWLSPTSWRNKDDMVITKTIWDQIGGRPTDWARDANWVADHIHVLHVKILNAPSPKAWSLLCWVRESKKNEDMFIRAVLRTMLKTPMEHKPSPAITPQGTSQDGGAKDSTDEALRAQTLKFLNEHAPRDD